MIPKYINLSCDYENDAILILWGINQIPPTGRYTNPETCEEYLVYETTEVVKEILIDIKLAAYKAEDFDIVATDDILRGYLADKIKPNCYYHYDAVREGFEK